MTMRASLPAEIQKWLHRNGHDLRSADLRVCMAQWKKAQGEDGFALRAPGRWKYFRHLLGYPWTYGEVMTRWQRVYSCYMKACAALVLGYHHLHLFDDARRKRKQWMARSSETMVTLPAKAKAAAATKS
jgi:hypothetical protein